MGCICSTARTQQRVDRERDDAQQVTTAFGSSEPPDDLDQIDANATAKLPENNQALTKLQSKLGGRGLNLISINGISTGGEFRGQKVHILAFEVANTIGMAANLMQSLSDQSIQYLKSVVLRSQGVRQLVSQDTMHLLMMVAADQRDEFRIFSAEVARFGNLCKDTQWHNLDRYIEKMKVDPSPEGKVKQEATTIIQQLIDLAQHTCELYHELNTLDRIEQDYRRKVREEESMPESLRGEGLLIYHDELKRQQKLIKNLKKSSLWSRNLHEIVEKLVEVARYLNSATFEVLDLGCVGEQQQPGPMVVEGNNIGLSSAFWSSGTSVTNCEGIQSPRRLGPCGLALYYANIVNHVTNIVSRPLSFNQNVRDALYHGLPAAVKASLCSRLQQCNINGELSTVQIKAEMHKILQWLSPLAESTIKTHQGFGWIGEFAKSGIEYNNTPIYTRKTTRIQTLYHADKEKTEEFILQLVVWLHHLVKQVKDRGYGGLKNVQLTKNRLHKDVKSPPRVKALLCPASKKTTQLQLSLEEREMLEHVNYHRQVCGKSRSHDSIFRKEEKGGKTMQGLTRSNGNSPSRGFNFGLVSSSKREWHLNSLLGLDTFD